MRTAPETTAEADVFPSARLGPTTVTKVPFVRQDTDPIIPGTKAGALEPLGRQGLALITLI